MVVDQPFVFPWAFTFYPGEFFGHAADAPDIPPLVVDHIADPAAKMHVYLLCHNYRCCMKSYH